MTSRLASLLVQDGLVSAKRMAEAFQRQVIYGGTLDTILLEMDVIDEMTLLEALGRASALPIAGDLPSLAELQAAKVHEWMPSPMVERYRAVPVVLDGNLLRVLVIDPPDRKQLDELGYTLSLTIDPIIVPEHRFVQAVELVYGVPVPARFASLAAKLRQRAADPARSKPNLIAAAFPAPPPREQRRTPVPQAEPATSTRPTVVTAPVVVVAPAHDLGAVAVIDVGVTAAPIVPAEEPVATATAADEAPGARDVEPGARDVEPVAAHDTERVATPPVAEPVARDVEPAAAHDTERVATPPVAEPVAAHDTERVATPPVAEPGATPAAERAAAVSAPDSAAPAGSATGVPVAAAPVESAAAASAAASAAREPVERRRVVTDVEVERRSVVTDVPMPGAKPAAAPRADEKTPAPRSTPRPPAAAEAAHAGAGAGSPPSPLTVEEARRAIDEAADRDAIFEALCRGARARLPFAAVLIVHGDTAAGRLALGASWFDRATLAAVAVSLEPPSPFRAAAVGRAPYLGRIGDDAEGTQLLASLGRKPPLPAVLMPVVLRERAVALLYGDNDGNELDADSVAELSTLAAAAARSFQRLILKAKSGDFAKAASDAAGKLSSSDAAAAGDNGAAGGWRRADAGEGERRGPRFSMALVNAVKVELTAHGGARGSITVPPREDGDVTAQPGATTPLPEVDGLCASIERQDERAQMSAEALVVLGERAAAAVVARLPGPLRLDRHALRGASPPLAEHGPLLAVLARMGRAARAPLLARLTDPSLEVRYYATVALGELKQPDVVGPLGARIYDPDAGVRRAAVDALARFGDSHELRALLEQLRAELPGPDTVRQRFAAEALGVLKDVPAVPRLIELVKHAEPAIAGAARKALVEITKQDFGTSRWRWRGWWDRHRDESRLEWMLEGLGHSEPDVRLSASEELRAMSPDYFGYAFDLPKREREDARKRWVEWWRDNAHKQQTKR